MTHEHVALARAFFPPDGLEITDIVAAGPEPMVAAWGDRIHPEFEAAWPTAEGWADAFGFMHGSVRGLDAYYGRYAEWLEAFERWRIRPIEFVDCGDRVLVRGRLEARSREGVEFEADVAAVWSFEGGSYAASTSTWTPPRRSSRWA